MKKVRIIYAGSGNSWNVKVVNKFLEKGVKYSVAWFRKVYYETFGE